MPHRQTSRSSGRPLRLRSVLVLAMVHNRFTRGNGNRLSLVCAEAGFSKHQAVASAQVPPLNSSVWRRGKLRNEKLVRLSLVLLLPHLAAPVSSGFPAQSSRLQDHATVISSPRSGSRITSGGTHGFCKRAAFAWFSAASWLIGLAWARGATYDLRGFYHRS